MYRGRPSTNVHMCIFLSELNVHLILKVDGGALGCIDHFYENDFITKHDASMR